MAKPFPNRSLEGAVLRGYSFPLIDLAEQNRWQVVVDKQEGVYLAHPCKKATIMGGEPHDIHIDSEPESDLLEALGPYWNDPHINLRIVRTTVGFSLHREC